MFKNMMVLLFMIAFLSACGSMEGDTSQNQEDVLQGNAMDNYNEPLEGQVGYVRYHKSQLNAENEQNHEVHVNREKMADMITRMILRYDGFNDVATLVTDYEVLVAYQAPENHDREQAADIVQKTAYSLVPSFYRVYVSDKPTAFGDIQSLSTSTVYDEQYREVVDRMIHKMKEAPQGKVEQNDDQMGHDRQGNHS